MNEKTIMIPESMAILIHAWKKQNKLISKEEETITKIIERTEDRASLSCRKISNILIEKYNIVMGKSKVHQILKNKLEFKYCKTSIKNTKIITNNSLKMANAFLKILIRAIRLKYELVYIDESKIQQINSNLHCWRKNNEYLFNDIKDYQKSYLIMAVSPNGLIYYKITSDNTNTDIFMNFFNGLLNKIGEERKKNSIFILDNCKIHISYKMIKYYQDNKVNK